MLFDNFFEDNNIKKPVVIYIHGFNGFKDWGNFDLTASQIATAGFVFIKMNLSHNGTTTELPEDFADLEAYGNNNYTKELFDVEQIINWICNEFNPFAHEIDSNKISVIGHSRGGGIAILKAGEDARIKNLITWASVDECKTPWNHWPYEKMMEWQETGVQYIPNKRTNQLMPLYFQLYENYRDHQERLDIEKAMKNMTIPVLICHGTNDEAVLFYAAENLKTWMPNAQLFTVESDHVFGRKHPWLEPNLPEAMQAVVHETISFLKQHNRYIITQF